MDGLTANLFSKLSTELIWAIVGFIPPESHLDFALTCKHLAQCCSDVLRRHRDACDKYHVSSDLDPATVLALFLSAFGFGDPIPAWHVRSFEVWRDRESWAEWKVYDLQTPIGNEISNESEPWSTPFGSISDLVESLKAELSDDSDFGVTQTKEGHDGIVKALLLAKLPRLRDLKFITQAHDNRSSLNWLSTLITENIHEFGFESLTSVAVGIPSNTWMDGSNDPSLPARIFCTLLTLPNIESIYYNDFICDDDEEDVEWKDIIPEKSSNVQHIFFDDCNNIPFKLQDAITAAPKGLLSMSFRAGSGSGDRCEDADRIVGWVTEYDRQGSTLEALMFYGFHDGNIHDRIHGYRCSVYRPEELKGGKQQDVSIDIQDVELDAYYNFEGDGDDEQAKMKFWKRFVEENFPSSMQTLTLWNSPGSSHFGDEVGGTEYVEAMAITLMKSQEFPDLSAIYLEEVERRSGVGRSNLPRSDKIAFKDAIEVGKKKGVDVYTITNRRTPRFEQYYPEAPDMYDLVTGPYQGKRPDDYVFDVYQGRRIPPGCGKCGECAQCLAEYTKELWATVPSKEEADEGEAVSDEDDEDEDENEDEDDDEDEDEDEDNDGEKVENEGDDNEDNEGSEMEE